MRFINSIHLHTQTRGRNPLDELPARPWFRHSHNKHNWRTAMPSVGFEPAIPAIKRAQSYTLDRAATASSLIFRQWRSNAKYCQYRISKFEILLDIFWYHHHHHAALLLILPFHFFRGIRILDCPSVEFILRQLISLSTNLDPFDRWLYHRCLSGIKSREKKCGQICALMLGSR